MNSWVAAHYPDQDFDNTGDGADVLKGVTSSVTPTKVAEEQHSKEAAAKGGVTSLFQKSPLPAVACPLVSKSARQDARRQEAEVPVCL